MLAGRQADRLAGGDVEVAGDLVEHQRAVDAAGVRTPLRSGPAGDGRRSETARAKDETETENIYT